MYTEQVEWATSDCAYVTRCIVHSGKNTMSALFSLWKYVLALLGQARESMSAARHYTVYVNVAQPSANQPQTCLIILHPSVSFSSTEHHNKIVFLNRLQISVFWLHDCMYNSLCGLTYLFFSSFDCESMCTLIINESFVNEINYKAQTQWLKAV